MVNVDAKRVKFMKHNASLFLVQPSVVEMDVFGQGSEE
jgi:hypothetical protein